MICGVNLVIYGCSSWAALEENIATVITQDRV